MAIAIFRHLKLVAAVPNGYDSKVLNFHPRRMHELRMDWDANKNTVVTLDFTRLDRRLGLLLNHDTLWKFHRGEFTVTRRLRRNDQITKERVRVELPAYSTVWTENGVVKPIYEQFEQQIASRIIVERYLHQHTANPFGYRVVEVNFDPKVMLLGRPQMQSHRVRPTTIVEEFAALDHSDSIDKWAQLFLD